MEIRTKPIAFCLAISPTPVSIVSVAGVQGVSNIGNYVQDQGEATLESQATGDLNQTVAVQQKEIQNLLDTRRTDAFTLADSALAQSYKATCNGEIELVREQSRA